MPSIEYDPSRSALYTPEKRETIFEAGQSYSLLQVAIEGARLAYFRAEQSASEQQRLANALARVGFGGLKLFGVSETGTQGFGAYRPADRTVLVGFRGTQPDELIDLLTDVTALPVPWTESAGRVHAGFAKAARSVVPQVRDWLGAEYPDRSALLLTGHSLGAALATLTASVLRPTMLITLGSPRVGDAAFAASVAGIEGARIVDCCDDVTEVPLEAPAYTHIRPPTYVTKDGVRIENPGAGIVDADRRRGRMEYFMNYAWKIGKNVFLRGLADHAPINYARAFF
jgi:hypothetical protein